MSPLLQSLGIDKMSREERLALVHEIWDIAEEADPLPLSDAQRRELRRRVVDYEANPENVIPWEEVKARTLDRLKQ